MRYLAQFSFSSKHAPPPWAPKYPGKHFLLYLQVKMCLLVVWWYQVSIPTSIISTNKLPYFKVERRLLRVKDSSPTCPRLQSASIPVPEFSLSCCDQLWADLGLEHHKNDLCFPYIFLMLVCLKWLIGRKAPSHTILLESGVAHNKWSSGFREEEERSC
jgi:hypothetical protein